jgi:hypothetical protein
VAHCGRGGVVGDGEEAELDEVVSAAAGAELVPGFVLEVTGEEAEVPVQVEDGVMAALAAAEFGADAEAGLALDGVDESVALVVGVERDGGEIEDGESHAAGDVDADGVGDDGSCGREHAADGQAVAHVGVGHEGGGTATGSSQALWIWSREAWSKCSLGLPQRRKGAGMSVISGGRAGRRRFDLRVLLGVEEGGDDAGGEGEDDDGEGDPGFDVDVDDGHFHEHLDADEPKDDGEAVFEEVELAHHGGEGEVEGAQAEDGEDVGGEDEEGVAGDADDGGDGIDGEDDVGGFDDEEDEEHGGHGAAAVGEASEEAVGVVGGRDGEDFAGETDEDGVLEVVGVVAAAAGDFDGGVDEEGTEDVEDPLEVFDKFNAGTDHDAAEDEGAQDAPEEDAVLVFGLDGEVGEDEGNDEDVVDAEGVVEVGRDAQQQQLHAHERQDQDERGLEEAELL